MDLDRGAQRRALAVTSGWDPAVHGGYGWGGAPAASAATRRVPNLPVDDVPELPPGGYAAPPGSTGGFVRFRNLAPRTRAERRSLTDKEALEKTRLRERTGGHHRYSDPGHLIAAPGPESAAFVDEQQRFVTDVAASDKARREEDHARRAAELLRRREREAKREDDRWQRMAEDKEKERDRVERMRQLGSKARRNKGSEPYDLVTQAYADDPAGARLKHQDDVIRYRAAMRAQFLQQKARGADFDLLTGQSRSLIDLPDEPKPEVAAAAAAAGSGRGSARRGGGH